jgi:hypothetical protein
LAAQQGGPGGLAGVLDEFGTGVDGGGDRAEEVLVVAVVEVGLVTAKLVARGFLLDGFGRWLHAPRPRARPPGLARSFRGVQPDRTGTSRCQWEMHGGVGRGRGGGWVGVERVLDASGDVVDRLGVLADGVEGAVFAPARDVWARLAAHIEADRGADDVGDAVDEHFGLFAAVVVVVEAEGVREFVK